MDIWVSSETAHRLILGRSKDKAPGERSRLPFRIDERSRQKIVIILIKFMLDFPCSPYRIDMSDIYQGE